MVISHGDFVSRGISLCVRQPVNAAQPEFDDALVVVLASCSVLSCVCLFIGFFSKISLAFSAVRFCVAILATVMAVAIYAPGLVSTLIILAAASSAAATIILARFLANWISCLVAVLATLVAETLMLKRTKFRNSIS